MYEALDSKLLLSKKITFNREIEVDGMKLLLKTMDNYEEYLESRKLIETMSRCSIIHDRELTMSMLKLPSFYPFVVKLVSDEKKTMHCSEVNGVSVDGTSVEISSHVNHSSSAECSRDINGTLVKNGVCYDGDVGVCGVIGYFEIYILPHLGRTFDSRMERVVTLERYRGRGIMSCIIPLVVEFCRVSLGCNRIDLTAENPIAIKVYNKIGFRMVDTTVFRLTL